MRGSKFYKVCITCAILCIFFIAAFYSNIDNNTIITSRNYGKIVLPEDVIEGIMANRLRINAIDEEKLKGNFEKFLHQLEDFEDELFDETLYKQPRKALDSITIDEALEDVDYLFSLLKYGYGAYGYFGGDTIFLEAKRSIDDEVNINEETISIAKLNKIIVDNLYFINDAHFMLGNNRLSQNYNYYYSSKYSFLKDHEGYYTLINNDQYYLIEVEEGEIEDYMKLSLDDEGNIVYNLGFMYQQRDLRSINIKLRGADTIINEKIIFTLIISQNDYDRKTAYNYSEIDGIPLIEIRSMFPNSEGELEQLLQFTEDAKKLQNRDLLIIDVRGNGGGSDRYPSSWVENYTGEKASGGIIASHLHTFTTIRNSEIFAESLVDQDLKSFIEEDNERVRSSDYFPGWSPINHEMPNFIENPNTIFVIIDGNIASSGETFVRMLRQIENVIFVGTNTSGMMLVGNNNQFRLPYSQINMMFGKTLILNSNLENIEGIGFKPDFWVAPDEALIRTLEFIKGFN